MLTHDMDISEQLQLLADVAWYKSEYDLFPLDAAEPPYVNNMWFCTVDFEVLYGIVRVFAPRRVIEIGSGHSTHITAAALAHNEPAGGTLISIDPDPRVRLPNVLNLEHMQRPVEQVPLDLFDELEAGDILFIDSSHIWAPGNDVQVEYHDIIPRLPAGVIVHIHDIFLPDDYPALWHDRGYNEARLVELLLTLGHWDILWSSHVMHLRAPEALADAFRSYTADDPGTGWRSIGPASLWLRKR